MSTLEAFWGIVLSAWGAFAGFFDAHPGAWIPFILFAWPIVSGAYLTILDSRLPRSDQDWADAFAKNPKLAAFNAFMKTAGFNLPGLTRSLRAFFDGPPPILPRPSQWAFPTPNAAPAKPLFESDPPGPPSAATTPVAPEDGPPTLPHPPKTPGGT